MLIFVVNIRPARTFRNSTHCLLSPFTLDWSRNLLHNPMWNMAVNNISYPIFPLSTRIEKGYTTKIIPFFFCSVYMTWSHIIHDMESYNLISMLHSSNVHCLPSKGKVIPWQSVKMICMINPIWKLKQQYIQVNDHAWFARAPPTCKEGKQAKIQNEYICLRRESNQRPLAYQPDM